MTVDRGLAWYQPLGRKSGWDTVASSVGSTAEDCTCQERTAAVTPRPFALVGK